MCGFVKRKFQYIHVCTPSKTNNYVTTILEKMSLLVYDRERRNSGLNKVKIVFKKLHKSCLPTNSLHVCYFKHILSIQEWIDQNTCLHLAVENGHYDVVKLSLDKRSDVNTPSSNYMHPLHLAAKAGDIRYCYSGSVWQNYFSVYNFLSEKERNPSTIVSKKIRLNNFHTVMYLKRRIPFWVKLLLSQWNTWFSGH